MLPHALFERLQSYKNYELLHRDLHSHSRDTRALLTAAFDNRQNGNSMLAHDTAKILVHGLADERLSDSDRAFFEGLLRSNPAISSPHMVGGLHVEHKTARGGKKRLESLVKLLSEPAFSQHPLARGALLSALRTPETAGPAEELLSKDCYYYPSAANVLISRLGNGELAESAKRVLSSKAFARPKTARKLASVLDNSAYRTHALDVLLHENYSTFDVFLQHFADLKFPPSKSGGVVELLSHEKFRHTADTVNHLVDGLNGPNPVLAVNCLRVLNAIAGRQGVKRMLKRILESGLVMPKIRARTKAFFISKETADKLNAILSERR